MKRFKTISTLFIVAIAVIFSCNIFYLVSLYNSIRSTVARDVMTALADADLDELWIRAERARAGTPEDLEERYGNQDNRPHGEASVYQDSNGDMVATTRHPDGKIETQGYVVSGQSSFTNRFINAVGQQFHGIIDPYVPADPAVMDSVLTKRLNDRYIYPDFVSTEVVDSVGNVVVANVRDINNRHDVFTYCYNPNSGLSYRVYMTPLTRHIFSEMSGVVVTILLLMVSFSLAFMYLYRTVSRLRTVEEMKDDFVSNMTHELKTPIAIAYSANDALLNYDTANDPDKKTKYLMIANKQLKRLGELVENILAMSMERRKTMKLKPEEIQLHSFVDEIVAAQRMRSEKNITINVDINESIMVEADRSHLANVLNNLIDNAIKYSCDASGKPITGDSVEITISGDNKGLSVKDNGIGIPSKSIPYLFNKFYRVPHGNRQDIRGYGIGLYYVKSILDKMSWSITVRSKEGEGSVFTINFNDNEK